MQRFDCLSSETQVLGPHFLEASAGTGKTFAIEHVFARLLSTFDLSQILVVTFTKAATRELKKRIRCTIRSHKAFRLFNEAQVFTIHGFCMRMLQEHAVEANLPIGLYEDQSNDRVDAALKDFFEFECLNIVAPEQLSYLMKESVSELAHRLKIEEPKKRGTCFSVRWSQFKEALQQFPLPNDLYALFQEIKGRYKAIGLSFEKQIEVLSNACRFPENPIFFRKLISPSKKILSHLKSENLKVKFKETTLPPFFDWARRALLPILEQASDPEEIFADLLFVWKPIQRQILLEEGGITPDEILRLMGDAVESNAFKKAVQKRYKAVLIDEFQDTDPLQWKIFHTLFLNQVDAFYLIGDPKQSIYRFRNADLYTYLDAKNAFAAENQFHLDTNFRSSKEMIEALNRLFHRNWLSLPKLSTSLPYIPVKAGAIDTPSIEDGKASVHFYSFEEDDLNFIVSEILHLANQDIPFSGFAILVKDRFELAKYLKKLSFHQIPVFGRTRFPITETLGFQCLYEWVQAVASPQHIGKGKRVLAGPLGGYTAQELANLTVSPFSKIRAVAEEKGIVVALRTYVASCPGWSRSFQADFEQAVELFFGWVTKNGFDFDRAHEFFETLLFKHPDEVPSQRGESGEFGVQIMTMHASKGLEFEIVFAVGIGSSSLSEDKETEAEKYRLLYVAMTRAKRRLYVPIPNIKKNTSPIHLFLNHISTDELNRLKEEKILSWETIDGKYAVSNQIEQPLERQAPPAYQVPFFTPSYLLSFSSLSQAKGEPISSVFEEAINTYTKHNLPRGSEMGVFIHHLFEQLFISKKWKSESFICQLVTQKILFTKWMPWKEVIIQMVQDVLLLPLVNGVSLIKIDLEKVLVEQEFLFEHGPHLIKGFIDLIFELDGKIYFIDWKTNWLGCGDNDYTEKSIQTAIDAHEYGLQASIYTKAILQGWGLTKSCLGGAIYLFLRGPKAVFWRPEIYV